MSLFGAGLNGNGRGIGGILDHLAKGWHGVVGADASRADPSTPINGSNGPRWGWIGEIKSEWKEFEREVLPEIRELAQEVREEVQEKARQLEETYGPEFEELRHEIVEEVRQQATTIEEQSRPIRQELREEFQSTVATLDRQFEPHVRQVKRLALPYLESLEQFCQPGIRKYQEEVVPRLTAIDDRFQQLVQERIDPLLGNARRVELQTLLNGDLVALRPEEKEANRRLGLGLVALSLALVSHLSPPFLPLAIAVGILASSSKYPLAYRQWKETGKIGAVHLICIYSLYLWLGGYATIGSIGAVLYGLMLKARAIGENQSRYNLLSLFQLQPTSVWIRRAEGDEIEIPFEQLQLGETLVLHAGQIVPVDGTLIAGEATIDQHMLTGESQPVEKGMGDPVLASTMVISGRLDLRVEKTSAETTAGQIAAILNRAAENTRPKSLNALAVADKMAVPTLGAVLVSWPLLGPDGAVSLIGANSTTGTYLSGSLAMLNYLNLAARQRILVKEGIALENLARVRTVIFDKTGTLTIEQPQVARIYRLANLEEVEILRLAAAAEGRQTHPVARAIVTAAAAQGVELPPIEDAHYEVGYGIRVRLAASEGEAGAIRVGSSRFMALEGIAVPPEVEDLTASAKVEGHSLVMVAVGNRLVGCLELQPTIRPEAREIVAGLRSRGVDLYIISGDQEAPTRKLAEYLGMTGYFANTLPEAKAKLVEELQAGGRKVGFIGDGINDAIAMRQADVSVSLRGATTVATDTAQIVLMDGSLDQLLHLFELSREFDRNMRLNIGYSSSITAVNVLGILLAGFSFTATELLYSLSLFGSLGIALKPLLDHRPGRVEDGTLSNGPPPEPAASAT